MGPATDKHFPSIADEIAEPHPDMNLKVAAFTVSEKSSNIYIYINFLGLCQQTFITSVWYFYVFFIGKVSCRKALMV